MLFRGSDGQSFELRILGYQFPRQADEFWDANWLTTEIRVTHAEGGWSATDPMLLTHEAIALAEWFEALAEGASPSGERTFTEPNIAFKLINGESGPTLRVYFEVEARPSWAPTRRAGSEDLWVEFPLSEIDLASAAESLRQQLEQFPQRGSR
jgi:hypothetical protein